MPPPCKPFTPCWCELHPTHPNCNPVDTPINGGIIYLLIASLVFGIWAMKRKQRLTDKQEKLDKLIK